MNAEGRIARRGAILLGLAVVLALLCSGCFRVSVIYGTGRDGAIEPERVGQGEVGSPQSDAALPGPDSGGAHLDVGPDRDGLPPDAGTEVQGSDADPPESDSGDFDTGTGPPDAGSDTGTGPPDAGSDTGAGPPDASPDTGSGPPDAGSDTGTDASSDTGPGPTDSGPDAGEGWVTQGNMPYAAGALTSAMLSDGLHVLGGGEDYSGSRQYRNHYVYNLTSKTWSSAPANVPDNDTWAAQAGAHDDKIYLIGGWPDGARRFIVYDRAGDSWSPLTAPPTDYSYAFGSAVVGGHFYVMGGEGQRETNARVYKYNFTGGTWTRCADIPQNREEGSFAVAAWGTKIYVLGGDTPGGATILQIYDTVADSWSTGTGLAAHHDVASVVADNGVLYFFGGIATANHAVPPLRDAVNIYDTATDQWFLGDPLPAARYWSTAQNAGGAFHMVGGFDSGDDGTATHWVYYP